MKCTLIILDEVWCQTNGLTPNHIEILYKKFAIHPEGYFFMPHYKLGRWDGFIRFFEKTGKTSTRLLDEILPMLEEWGYDIELVDNRQQFKSPKIPGKITKVDKDGIATEAEGLDVFGDVMLGNKQFKLRPYQLQCVQDAIEAGSGTIIGGTGMGKTSVTATLSHLYSQIGYKVITIVPSSDLVDQTAEWYEMLGMDVGLYSGSDKDLDHGNIVATWQAIQYNPGILKDFQVVIWDEFHGAKSTVAKKLLNEDGKHIAFRFGVTGTYPKPEVEKMSLHVSVGSVLREITAAWLIENGYLARVEIQPVELIEQNIEEEFVDYSAEKAFLSKSLPRMEMIADLIISKCAEKGNTLVLVNSIPFGQKLASLIKGAVFLYGNSAKDLRKEHYQMFEDNNDLIVIASVGIASTGISIDRIFCLMLIDPGKSFIKAIQSVGRSLRLGHDKTEVIVIDVYSKLKWAVKHFKDRCKWNKEAKYPILKTIKLKIKGK